MNSIRYNDLIHDNLFDNFAILRATMPNQHLFLTKKLFMCGMTDIHYFRCLVDRRIHDVITAKGDMTKY